MTQSIERGECTQLLLACASGSPGSTAQSSVLCGSGVVSCVVRAVPGLVILFASLRVRPQETINDRRDKRFDAITRLSGTRSPSSAPSALSWFWLSSAISAHKVQKIRFFDIAIIETFLVNSFISLLSPHSSGTQCYIGHIHVYAGGPRRAWDSASPVL